MMSAAHILVLRLRRAARRIAAARSGNVAITFALALIPILALVGAAVDFSRANSLKAVMQSALDSTALMVSKNAASLTSEQIQSSAQSYFLALFTRPEAKNVKFTTSYSTSGGSSLVVNASADMDTDFTGVLGYKTITVVSASTAKWGSSRLRVALVLDTTGSMSDDGKIVALKTATKNLLTQLQGAVTINGDVYVSIIPFSKNVNLDPSNYAGNWIDWTDWESEPAILKTSKPNNWNQIGPGSSCPFTSSNYGFRCTADPANNSASVSTIPASGSYSGYICPGVDGGNKDSTKIGIYYNGCYNSVPTTTTSTNTICSGWSCSCGNLSNCSCTGNGSSKICKQTVTTTGAPYTHNWIKNDHSTWNGCVTDRDQNFDTTNDAPIAGGNLYPAEQYSSCPAQLMGLSYDWTALTNKINAMQPNGNTNQAIGLQMGWQTLTAAPFTVPPMDPNYKYNQVIILLTDGLNTQDRWYTSQSSIDTRQQKTCDNIKAAGITLYTVQVNTGNDPTSTLLKNCASDSSKFFLLTSSTEIVTTFNQIGTALSNLRLSM